MIPQPGDIAPDFNLRTSRGRKLTLSELRGQRVVLIFYPFAFSGICTPELCGIRDISKDFNDLDAVTLGISCDSFETVRAFADQEELKFELLSDFWPHGEVAKKYGVFFDKIGAADRGTFVIDRQGVIAGSVVTDLGTPRDPEEYKRILAEID